MSDDDDLSPTEVAIADSDTDADSELAMKQTAMRSRERIIRRVRIALFVGFAMGSFALALLFHFLIGNNIKSDLWSNILAAAALHLLVSGFLVAFIVVLYLLLFRCSVCRKMTGEIERL